MEQPVQRLRRDLHGGRHHRSHWRFRFSQSPFLLPFPILLFVLLITFASSEFKPEDQYLLDCGATEAANSVADDGRDFSPDDPLPSNLHSTVRLSIRRSKVHTNPVTTAPVLYRTARSFSRSSSYHFTINIANPMVVRLHFYPFSDDLFSSSNFSVYASGFPLLSSYTPVGDSFPIIKEFFFKPLQDSLTLSFSPEHPSSLAFVNAIELFSVPTALFLSTSPGHIDTQVLQTLHRFNVGGEKVTPANDSLSRTWLPDDDASGVYETKSLGVPNSTTSEVRYPEGGTTSEVAPSWIYSSARVMYSTVSPAGFNLSWAVEVGVNHLPLLVRMHYCDFMSAGQGELRFDSYINNQNKRAVGSAQGTIDPSAPYYKDDVVNDSSRILRVAVGPSNNNMSEISAFLNGFEVFAVLGVWKSSEQVTDNKTLSAAVIIGTAAGGAAVVLGIIAATAFVLLRTKQDTRGKTPTKPPTTTAPGTPSTTPWAPSITNGTDRGASRSTDRSSHAALLHMNFELRIPYEVILAATNRFDSDAQIGSGGFGKVYKGKLSDGRAVAVKRGKLGSQHGQQQFESEILILSKTRHRHLVSFVGYCSERGEMILVYEFMERGTLQSHLYGSSNNDAAVDNPCLTWKQRLRILIGAAQGLDYLHTGQEPGIIHRDVKSANILLDLNYVAKVADFGISKLAPPSTSAPSSANDSNAASSFVKGTIGYLDPEYFHTEQLTNKSDVYSFGVVLLEVACARPALVSTLPDDEVCLADWGLKWIAMGKLSQIVDSRIRDEVDPNSLRTLSSIAEKCLASDADDRPTMHDVVWNLNYALTLQETSLRREPLDDSVVGSSVASISIVREFPVPADTGSELEESTELTSGISNAFSHQLMTDDDR